MAAVVARLPAVADASEGDSASLSASSSSSPSLSPLPSLPSPSSDGTAPADPPRLSRKRAAAAALPSLSLGGVVPGGGSRPPPVFTVDSDEDDSGKRQRFESVSSSQSSTSGSDSEGSLLGPPESAVDDATAQKMGQRYSQPMGGGIYEDTPSSSSSSASASSSATVMPLNTPLSAACITSAPVSVSVLSGTNTARIVIGNHRRTKELGPLLENNSQVGGYTIVGVGRECSAVHNETGAVVTAQVISRAELDVMEAVVERLKQAERLCEDFYDWDVEDLCERVLPSACEVVEEPSLGRLVLFSPRSYGSLHSYVHKKESGCGLPEHDVTPIFKQTVRILAFCHTLGIVVRDLKPRKLVFRDENLTQLRLSDVFDVAVCEDPDEDIVNEKFGSPAYVPPEVRNCVLFLVLSSSRSGFAGRPADIWGLGVLTYLLLVGKYPFFDSTPKGVFEKIRRARVVVPPVILAKLSPTARMIVHGLLRKRPDERPTAVFLTYVPWSKAADDTASMAARYRVNHVATANMTNTRNLLHSIQQVAYALRDFPESPSIQEVPSDEPRAPTRSELMRDAAANARRATETTDPANLDSLMLRTLFGAHALPALARYKDHVVPTTHAPQLLRDAAMYSDHFPITEIVQRTSDRPIVLQNTLELSQRLLDFAHSEEAARALADDPPVPVTGPRPPLTPETTSMSIVLAAYAAATVPSSTTASEDSNAAVVVA